VCLAPVWIAAARRRLGDSGVRLCAVAGFPHGANKPTIKAIECTSAIKDGADEVDVVAHLPHVLAGDAAGLRTELLEIVRAARATRRDAVVKVIVESALLEHLPEAAFDAAIDAACRGIRESGCDFIKTSTGFHPQGGASVRAVRAMKRHAEGLGIKAAGGIRDLATAQAMLAAGADRLGCSASLAILGELDALRGAPSA
jgi:deoxyribose-phosphate aldolase